MSYISYYGVPTTTDLEGKTFDIERDDGTPLTLKVIVADPVRLTLTCGGAGAAYFEESFTGVSDTVSEAVPSTFGYMPPNSSVTFHATAGQGMMFAGWRLNNAQGTLLSTSAVYTTVVTEDTTVCAVFEGFNEFSISYDGIPTQAGQWRFPGIRENGADVTIIVDVLESTTPDEVDTCYLLRFKDETSDPLRLDMPMVQSIEENDTATLAEISTIIYGFEDNFVMDVGVVQRYTVDFLRVQPSESKNDSPDPSKWSNGYWLMKF